MQVIFSTYLKGEKNKQFINEKLQTFKMNKEIIKYKNIASIIAILMLLLAIPSGIWPYGYYVVLRWVVTGVAIFILWIPSNAKQQAWLWWSLLGVALLFNPIFPFHLDKEIWVVIDFVAVALFLVSIFKVKPRE